MKCPNYVFASSLLFVVSATCFSAAGQTPTPLKMKPGLWKMKIISESDGKKVDINAELSKVLKNLPPEQRKAMLENMKGMKGAISPTGETSVCYTKQMLDAPESIVPKEHSKNCDTKFTTRNSTKLEGEFSCNDGTKGKMTWTVVNEEKLVGTIESKSKTGHPTKVHFTSYYSDKSCGDVQPAGS